MPDQPIEKLSQLKKMVSFLQFYVRKTAQAMPIQKQLSK